VQRRRRGSAERAGRRGPPAGHRGADPVERVKVLLAAREPYYKLADYEIAADGKQAADVAEEVVRLARLQGGW